MSKRRGRKPPLERSTKKLKLGDEMADLDTDSNRPISSSPSYRRTPPSSPPYALSPQYAPPSPPYRREELTAAPRTEVIQNTPFNRNRQLVNSEIIEQLTNLGTEISAFSDSNRDTSSQTVERYNRIKTQLIEALDGAFQHHQAQVVELEQSREANMNQMMEDENNRIIENLRQEFLLNIQTVTNALTTELNYGEQVHIYKDILDFLQVKLNNATYIRETQSEPDQLKRLSEVINIAYNYSLEQMALTISGIKNSTPEVTRKTVAIITSSLMLYNYQSEEIRQLYNNIPYFGQFFQVMNQSNNILKIVSNSAGTVTTVYYLLRNSGVDVDRGLELVRDMAVSVTPGIVTTVSDATVLATGTILNYLGNMLGSLITREYNNFQLNDSQSSDDTYNTAITAQSILSYVSVNELLNEPIIDGGIKINQNLNEVEQNIIQERFEAIINNDSTDPIINSPTEMASSQNNNSQLSVSDISEESRTWQQWLFGSDQTGGRRRYRKRMNKRVSRKIRRRSRKTKKNKKVYKKHWNK